MRGRGGGRGRPMKVECTSGATSAIQTLTLCVKSPRAGASRPASQEVIMSQSKHTRRRKM